MNTEAALKTMGRHHRRIALAEMDAEFIKLTKRLRRQHTIKLWLHQSLVTIGFVVVAGATVALMMSL